MSAEIEARAIPTEFPDGELWEAAELGAVDERSVRVWGRAPGAPELRARLEVDGVPPVEAAAPLSAETDWTGAVRLELPVPAAGRAFVCSVQGRRLTGRMAPSPGEHSGFTFGFGSCHRPFEMGAGGRIGLNAAAGIYPAMVDELRRADAGFVLLVGDQLYSDELPPLSVRRHLPGDEAHPPPVEVALAAYRRVARVYLGEAGFRNLREAFPTSCIWDDHDIFNDWGSRLRESPLDRCLFAAASRVYREYQHPRNPSGGLGPPYPYRFRYGTAGFLVLDVRGARDYRTGSLLGDRQWADAFSYLRGAEARDIHTLFVVVSVPVAHVARWVVALFERVGGTAANEVRDRWCSAAFVDHRDAFLAALFAWQAGAPHRQVILLSGDVHAASAFTIRRRRAPGVIHQFTSSAFTTQSSAAERLFNRIATWGPNLLEPDLRIRRHRLVLANNFGLVRVEPLADGGHRVAFDVRAWQPASRRLLGAGRVVVDPATG